jgi:DNA repair protein RadA
MSDEVDVKKAEEKRIKEIVERHLEEIAEIKGIGKTTLKQLEDAGYIDLQMLAATMPRDLRKDTEIGDKTADKIIEAARDKVGMGFMDLNKVQEKEESIEFLKTGSKALDGLLGGGVPTQSITECYGAFSSGKTQLGLQLAANALRTKENGGLGGDVAFIDTESTFRLDRFKQLLEITGFRWEDVSKRVLYAHAYNSDHQVKLVEDIRKQLSEGRPIKLIIVDSLTAHFRVNYQGRGELADRQQVLNKHIHTLQALADVYNVAIYVTNQVMSNPDPFSGGMPVPAGGHVAAHNLTYRIWLRKSKEQKRVAKLVDSPNLPDDECIFKVTEAGIVDSEETIEEVKE